MSTVESCLIGSCFSVDTYPNHGESVNELSVNPVASGLLALCSGKNCAHCPPEEEYRHESYTEHH